MAAIGKMIFGFLVIGLCLAGTVLVISQSATTPNSGVNIGNTDALTNASSPINQSAVLVGQTSAIMLGGGVGVLIIIGALIILGAISFIALKRGR